MNPRQKQELGHTGVHVTRLGLGTAAMPGLYTGVDPEAALEAVRETFRQGLNFIDTAPMYGHGRSEEILGEALAGLPRDSYVLSTKVGRVLIPEDPANLADSQWKNVSPYRWEFDFRRDAILRSFESSLERMKVDRIDVLLIHDPDDHWETAIREAYPAVRELREQGVVKAIGAGMNQWQMLQRFAEEGDFDCFLLAGRYTLIDQTALAEFLPVCERKGISIIIGGPYNSGILAGGDTFNYVPAPPELMQQVRQIGEVCARHGVDRRAAALQFGFGHTTVASVIPGARTPQELAENVRLMETPIPADLWEELRFHGLLPDGVPVPTASVL
jgi:D-threo-aldose 1-dehydrogenase